MCQDFCAQCPRCRGDQRSVPLTDSPTKYKCNYFFAFFFLFSGKYHVKMATFEERIHVQVVVAIGFGTTYSGYAISMDADYKIDPLKITTQQWLSDEICTEKTPTSVLFDQDKNFASFGYDTQRLKRNMTLKDDQGRPMRALDVFSASIRYMNGEVWEKLQNAIMKIKESDIHWVLTVPAIWEDGAKQFMRLAANKVT